MAIDLDPPLSADEGSRTTQEPPAWRPWAIRGGVVVAFLVFLQVTAPEVISASTSNASAALRVFGLTAGFFVWSWLIGKLVSNRWAGLALVAVPAIAVSVWALRPYYVDEVVDEEFPVAATASDPVDDVTDGSTTPEAADTAPADDTVVAPVPAATPEPEPTPTPPPTEPAGPVALASGEFQGLTGHRGNGTATVFDLGDGSQVIRLENFDVSNGPGLEIHLVPGIDQRRPADGTKIADLKGNQGNQNYDVPAGIDVSQGDWTILIWCDPFTVEVANATLS